MKLNTLFDLYKWVSIIQFFFSFLYLGVVNLTNSNGASILFYSNLFNFSIMCLIWAFNKIEEQSEKLDYL